MIYFDKQIQEEIKHIEFQMEHLNEEEFLEDIKDENPVIEAFQKDKTEKKAKPECLFKRFVFYRKKEWDKSNPS